MGGDRYFIRNQNAIYYVTFTVVNWLDVFIRPSHKHVIIESLNYCIKNKGLNVHCWCLMSSHLHMIISANDGYKISDIIRDFKKHTAVKIIEKIKVEPESRRELFLKIFKEEGKRDARISTNKFWQESNHAIELDCLQPELINQKIDYIHKNPVEQEIVDQEYHYIYSSAKDYANEKGLVNISKI